VSRRTKIVIGVLAAIIVLGVVGSLNGSKDSGTGAQSGDTSTCPTASDAFLAGLQSGFKKNWKNAEVTHSAYVQTGETWINGEAIYTVAVEVNGDIAVFGTDTDPTATPYESGLIIAANDTARSISVWGSDAAPGSPILEAFADGADVTAAEACQPASPAEQPAAESPTAVNFRHAVEKHGENAVTIYIKAGQPAHCSFMIVTSTGTKNEEGDVRAGRWANWRITGLAKYSHYSVRDFACVAR